MVSVIVPNYNHAPYLKKRIDSVLDQTYQDFELIILDDYSEDNSSEIIEEYRNCAKVSHIIYNDKNSGSPFKQWKKGIELSKGDYIWIAESDDYADKCFLEKSISSFEKDTEIVLSFTGSNLVDNDDNIIHVKNGLMDTDTISCRDFLYQYMLYGNEIYNASMVLFSKKALNNCIWGEIVKYQYCGDWLFWGSMLYSNENCKIYEVSEPLNYFRSHALNVSNNAEHNGLSILEGLKIAKKIFEKLRLTNKKEFINRWLKKWKKYNSLYKYTFETNMKIFIMFLTEEPFILRIIIKKGFKSIINI